MLPSYWSPNLITWIGNIAIYLASTIMIVYGGVKYHDEKSPPNWTFLFAAACISWFSCFDYMDGQRARRLKCGTPLGRIIDEAGDVM